MSEKKQWVQHISGQGEKWEVVADNPGNPYQWWVRSGPTPCGWHYLPKSEYRLCEPPEVWRDVTGECVMNKDNQIFHENSPGSYGGNVVLGHGATALFTGYRLRKVQLGDLITDSLSHRKWAFIIEKKVSQ